ncbi:hypothetical protein D3A96_01855 [Robertkochia marina]|nr:hypothetical protein D3A96_01855 [Robertkochia marina]
MAGCFLKYKKKRERGMWGGPSGHERFGEPFIARGQAVRREGLVTFLHVRNGWRQIWETCLPLHARQVATLCRAKLPLTDFKSLLR